jgi:aminomethyltransferase
MHRRHGAKIVPFAGFEMPVQYTGVIEEHRAVRNRVGLFDVSHMGEIEVHGKDALGFVQKITTNDVSRLDFGKVQYSAMCDDQGGIIDDLLVYRMEDHFMLVVNAANIAGDFQWMQEHAVNDVDLRNASDEIALIAVQGPRSGDLLCRLSDTDISSLAYYRFIRGTVAGVKAIISRTGYTGELGYEIYFRAEKAIGETIWDSLMQAGKDLGVCPVGLGARDTLRLEMGFCLYGNDIDRTTNPLEAGLGWITKLGKGEFIGRSVLLKEKEKGPKRRLVGFVIGKKALPRKGYAIKSNGVSTGMVTSGSFSPTLDQGIGMGYVGIDNAETGGTIDVEIRANSVPATIVDVPFVRKENR